MKIADYQKEQHASFIASVQANEQARDPNGRYAGGAFTMGPVRDEEGNRLWGKSRLSAAGQSQGRPIGAKRHGDMMEVFYPGRKGSSYLPSAEFKRITKPNGKKDWILSRPLPKMGSLTDKSALFAKAGR
jgi:hypothetical protein